MDDFSISSLHESKNEWGARLLTILTPLIVQGFKSIFDESITICKNNNELNKYLMTFQNLISRIPKWNSSIILNEKTRIVEQSRCEYLEELVACIHITQLKILTTMRVGQKQKKININIPKLDDFVHQVYINVARKIYKNVYLFEIDIPPLQIQKHNRELELIIQECILNTVRDSIPVDQILKAYMDETVEEEISEETKEEIVEQASDVVEQKTIKEVESIEPAIKPDEIIKSNSIDKIQELKFNDVDTVLNPNNHTQQIDAPKTIERLEEISTLRNNQRKNDLDECDDSEKLNIHIDDISMNGFDIQDINATNLIDSSLLLEDIEILA